MRKTMKNNKLGLYARYSKIDGSFLRIDLMTRSSAFKSNNDSKSTITELLTENVDLIYDFPSEEIPIISQTWSAESLLTQCDSCGGCFDESEFYQLDGVDESNCNICKNCQ